ncbi:hypothetical protein CVT24_004658 [Panaeolus cyanescens]|uniref:G domain-containing protein n=1 Tax=Panaeolus cyanescens TaxID=181874 RepID=A0A409YSH5_9AGAR|nr:hypothetical protein CVT24_004658 [Panaeolus cyanescens]
MTSHSCDTAVYNDLQISGPISIEDINNLPDSDPDFIYSSRVVKPLKKALKAYVVLIHWFGEEQWMVKFIESLSGGIELGIAKDQLEGFTQHVHGYRIRNVKWTDGKSIILIDTPGLSDEKISENRIFKMIQEWLKSREVALIHRVIYFDRITDVRMSGSRWKSIQMVLQSLQRLNQRMGDDSPSLSVVHLTTMWDTLPSDSHRKRAEIRFRQIEQTINEWHDLPQIPLYLGKFHNTVDSALQILDLDHRSLVLIRGWKAWEPFSDVDDFTPDDVYPDEYSRNGRFRAHLYQNLEARVTVTKDRLRANAEELEDIEVCNNSQLQVILLEQRDQILETLRQLEIDLQNFGRPPGEEFQGEDIRAPRFEGMFRMEDNYDETSRDGAQQRPTAPESMPNDQNMEPTTVHVEGPFASNTSDQQRRLIDDTQDTPKHSFKNAIRSRLDRLGVFAIGNSGKTKKEGSS